MELENIEQKAAFLALELLVVEFVKAFIAASPGAHKTLEAMFHSRAEKLKNLHPKEASAEEGDLAMAEFQDAWAKLQARVLSKEP